MSKVVFSVIFIASGIANLLGGNILFGVFGVVVGLLALGSK